MFSMGRAWSEQLSLDSGVERRRRRKVLSFCNGEAEQVLRLGISKPEEERG